MNEDKGKEEPPSSKASVDFASAGFGSDASPSQSPDENSKKSMEEKPAQPTMVTQNKKENDKQVTLEEKQEGKEKYTQDTDEYYTIDDAVNAGGYGKFQKFLTFLAGLGWLADAFEIIILSIIGDMLACTWNMARWQNALLTSIVFVGMTVGAPSFGNFADRYGRRTSLAISMLLLFIFGAASAVAPNYTWIVVLRGLMGFALGGVAQGVTLCCEYYPANVRGRAGFYLSYYWAIGAIGVILTAWLVMTFLNDWRVFVFLASVPALIVFLSMKWYPESARYYLVSNQREKAVKVLQRLMRMNKKELPKGKLVEIEKGARRERGKISDLLKPKMLSTTLLFWYIWLAVAMAYYGLALIQPLIIKDGNLVVSGEKHKNTTLANFFTSKMPCETFDNHFFITMLWTTAAEFPGLLFFTLIVEKYSRKAILGTGILVVAFFQLILMLDIRPKEALYVALFICRGTVAAVFQLLFIMTTEAFPTTLRASAMGTGSGCARFGGLLIPLLAQVAVLARPIPSMSVLAAITALAGIAAYLLPQETKGEYMKDVMDDIEI